jgi:hypothetical protein
MQQHSDPVLLYRVDNAAFTAAVSKQVVLGVVHLSGKRKN